jgi:polysaccharide chain length determinant protein (PEP-CTERM system associated)
MDSLYQDIRIALHGIWSRRWIALGIAWALCVAGWVALSFIPNRYETHARLFVRTGSVLPDQVGISDVDQLKAIDQIRQTLTSAETLGRVVRGTDLALTAPTDAAVAGKVAALKTGVKVVAQQDNLLDISAQWGDQGLSDAANAKISAQIVAKLIDIIREDDLVGGRNDTARTLKFLDAQIAARAQDLQLAEQRRVAFEQKYGAMLPGSGTIGERVDAARNELSQVESQLVSAQSALAAMNGQLAGTPATIPGAPLMGGGGGGSALSAAQAELAAARARGWTDSHPDVIALRRQIDALRRAAGGSPAALAGAQTANPAYLSLKSMQAERAATVAALNTRKAQIEADLNSMAAAQSRDPGLAAEQDRIDRDYAAIKTQYDKLLSDREDVRLRGEATVSADAGQFRVIDPPAVPSVPASPNRPLLLLGVLVVGIGAGVGGAFALGQLRTTYPTATRLARATGLPVIGAISETLSAAQGALRAQRLRRFAGASGALAGLCLVLLAVEFIQRGLPA